MNLAFYYHIPIVKDRTELKVPGYLGVFIDSLADCVEELFLVMHQPGPKETEEADYTLKAKNIRIVDLGSKTPAWHRAIFHNKILKKKLKQIEVCGAFLVRSPSPLAPYFKRYINQPKLIFLVVGDYAESVLHEKITSFRQWVIMKYLAYNDHLFRKMMTTTDTIVNSPALFKKYKPIAKSIHQIKTTTLSKKDLFNRKDTCLQPVINVLYAGRIDPLKGLFELTQAISILINKGFPIHLHFVGWETIFEKPVEKSLIKKGKELGIDANITFHGRKSVGDELNKMYQMADIYAIPSYEEGFPRTIWEAMANCLPVIATKVGAIPDYLRDKEDALLIEPKNVPALVNAIEQLINDKVLRQRLIQNGLKIATENTLEIQTKKLVDIIKELAA